MTENSQCQIGYKDEGKATVAFAQLLLKGFEVEQELGYKFKISHAGCEYLESIQLKPDTEAKI